MNWKQKETFAEPYHLARNFETSGRTECFSVPHGLVQLLVSGGD